jgi:hypothetical protein
MQHQIGKSDLDNPRYSGISAIRNSGSRPGIYPDGGGIPARGIIVETVRCIAHPQISYAFFHPHGFPGPYKVAGAFSCLSPLP